MTRGGVVAMLLVFVVSSGCHVSRQTAYPEFAAKKSGLGDLTILTDCMIIQGLVGDTDKIDLVENKDLGVATLEKLTDNLREKGYGVRQSTLTSIGLLMNHNKPYRVAASVYDVHLPPDDLPVETPPFYLDPSVSRDTVFQMALAYMYTSVLNSGQKESGVKTVVPYATAVGKKVETRAVVVLLTGGINVNLDKETLQQTVSTISGQDMVAVHPITRLSMMLYILDTSTGEVIWEDRIFKNGGLATKDRILSMLEDLLGDLP